MEYNNNLNNKLSNLELIDASGREVNLELLSNKFAIAIIGFGMDSIDEAAKINEYIYQKYKNDENIVVFMVARTGAMPFFVPRKFVRSEVAKRIQKDEISLIDFDDKIIGALNVDIEDILTCIKVFDNNGEERLSMYNVQLEEAVKEIENILEV